MQSPLTIVISSYNYSQYIGQAIESVIQQTSPEWQLVIYDNRSTDNTLEVIKPFLADPRVSLVVRDTNIGARANVSQALQSITTEFATHLQADDFLDQVFEGREPFDFAELVDDQSHGEPPPLHLFQQFADRKRARHKKGGMEMIANPEFAFLLKRFEDILVVKNADHLVQFAFIHRYA